MKKLFYGLGSVAAIAAPVAAVVSCGSDDEATTSSKFSASVSGTKLTITVSEKGTSSELQAELSKLDAKALGAALSLTLVSKADSKVTQNIDLAPLSNGQAGVTAETLPGFLVALTTLDAAFANCFEAA